jgi:16S rRNA processing protein RimM
VSSSESRTEGHLRIGALKRPHGLRGEIAVQPVGSFPEEIRKGARVAAVESPGRPSSEGSEVFLEIESARPNGRHVLVKFKGRDSIEAVAPLSGMDLTIHRASLRRPAEDFLFDDEVLGFACVSPSGEVLGRAFAPSSARWRRIGAKSSSIRPAGSSRSERCCASTS